MTLTSLAVLEVAAGERRVRLRERVSLPLVALVVAVLYFAWVALLGLRVIALPSLEPGIGPADWAVGGAVLMLLLLVLLFYDYQRNKGAVRYAAPAAAPAYAPSPTSRWIPDELVVTAETWQQRRVLEYSRPPKSEHRNAVYAKCVVPVDEQLALRLEELIAEARG